MKPKLSIFFTAICIACPVSHADTVFSWETGTEGWFSSTPAVATVETSPTSPTDGAQSLKVTLPMSSMWYNDFTRIQLDESQRQALFEGAQSLTLDVTYPDPGYNSWYGTPTVEMVVEDQGYVWNSLGSRNLTVGGTATCTWSLTPAQASAFAIGTSAKVILRFNYGNGGATGTQAVFYVDKLISIDPPPPPPFTSNYYWKGSAGTSWAGNNWRTAEDGITATPSPLPSDGSEAVAFSAAGAANLSTVLGADQDVLSVNFNEGSGDVVIGGTHNLTIGAGGITANEGSGAKSINIAGLVILSADQLWRNNSTEPLTVASEITGGYQLVTGGTGTTVLSKSNSHNGGTGMKLGRLELGNAGALGDTANIFSADAGTLDLMGFSPTLGGLSGGGVITNSVVGTSTLTIGSFSDTIYLGKLNDNASDQRVALAKNGFGTLTLSGLGNFTGDVNVNEGVLIAATPLYGPPTTGSLGNSQVFGRSVTVASSGTLRLAINNVFGNQNADFSLLPLITVTGGLLECTRYNTIGNVVLDGATMGQASSDTGNYQGYQFKGGITVAGSQPSLISSAGKGNHLSSATPFNVPDITGDAAADLTVTAPLLNQSGDFASAAGGLIKTGAGTLSLEAVNAFTGTALVLEGTLRTTGAFLNDCTVDVAETGASLHLDFAGLDIISDFKIDGVSQAGGEYGSLTSGAQHPVAQITGSGKLYVAPADPFDDWILSFPSLTGTSASKAADPDFDGQSNVMEFALNGNPADGAPSGKVRSGVETVSGGQALVITLPVRGGATFTGSAPAVATILAERLTYSIAGSNDLTLMDQNVTEISASDSGLPLLDEGWTYHTFRLNGTIGGAAPRGPTGFLRAGVIEIP
ncbi:MAG: autotransporter-associated beta strand repeat-containing protein [Verrucomicrobiota bacterium]